MRGGMLPAALIFAALSFALAFAPKRVRAPALLVAAAGAALTLAVGVSASAAEYVYFACWASVVVAAASIHLHRGVPDRAALALALACGLSAGAVTSLSGGLPALLTASPALLLVLPAAWLASSGRGIAVKVVASWLIAIALLAAFLPLTPTPGYEPDHME